MNGMVAWILPVLLAQTTAMPLAKGFAPNPYDRATTRAPGGSMSLSALTSCAGAPSGAMVSRSAALTLDVAEGLTHLALQVSEAGDGLVARDAQGDFTCSKGLVLTLDAKPGKLEIFVITPTNGDDNAELHIKVLDTDRPHELPPSVRRLTAVPGNPLVLDGELAAGTADNIPNAQLDVQTTLEHLEWKLTGAATDVWISNLATPSDPPVRAPPSLAAGKYAVWIRGTGAGAFTAMATAEGAKLEALKVVSMPAADAPVEGRALSAFLPGLEPQSLQGWSREAVALRQRAFIELPASFFVFASADSEVLLITAIDGKQADVISADGAQLTMGLDELTTKPASGPRVHLRTLPAEVPLEALTTDRDPRLKKLEQQRASTDACVARVKASSHEEDETDALARAAKRCNVSKLEKAKKKLEADLRKGFAKKRTTDLSRVDKRLKTLLADERVSSAE